MKKSILILAVVSITTSLFAQDKTSFFQTQIMIIKKKNQKLKKIKETNSK